MNQNLNYPIYGVAGDDGFIHKHGDDTVPPVVRYRFGKSRVVASLPSNYMALSRERKTQALTEAMDEGRFYTTAGNIELANIRFTDGVLSAEIAGSNPIAMEWRVISDRRGVPLQLRGDECVRAESGPTRVYALSAAIRINEGERYVRVEVRRTRYARVTAVTSEAASKRVTLVGVTDDFESMAVAGEAIHCPTCRRTNPGMILRSERIDSGAVNVWLLDDTNMQGDLTDPRFRGQVGNRLIDVLQQGDEVKIVQRAWLQPVWGRGFT